MKKVVYKRSAIFWFSLGIHNAGIWEMDSILKFSATRELIVGNDYFNERAPICRGHLFHSISGVCANYVKLYLRWFVANYV